MLVLFSSLQKRVFRLSFATVDPRVGSAQKLTHSFRVNLIPSDGENLLLSAELRVGKGGALQVGFDALRCCCGGSTHLYYCVTSSL